MTLTTKKVLQCLLRSSYLDPMPISEIIAYVWSDRDAHRQLFAMRYMQLLRGMDLVQFGDGYRGYCLTEQGLAHVLKNSV